jgi:hypothetical protein
MPAFTNATPLWNSGDDKHADFSGNEENLCKSMQLKLLLNAEKPNQAE